MSRLLGCLLVLVTGTPLCAQEINWKFEKRLESVEKRLDVVERQLGIQTTPVTVVPARPQPEPAYPPQEAVFGPGNTVCAGGTCYSRGSAPQPAQTVTGWFPGKNFRRSK